MDIRALKDVGNLDLNLEVDYCGSNIGVFRNTRTCTRSLQN